MNDDNSNVEDAIQKANEYFAKLGAEAAAIWQIAERDNLGLSRDELAPIVREMYARYHSPALFRVGVTFTDEQKSLIQKLVEQQKTVEAQKIILDHLHNEFDE